MEYPRPDFLRTELNWESLNGPWDFMFDDDDVGLQQGWHSHGLPSHSLPEKFADKRSIIVPFAFQAPASGVGEREVHEVLWYERQIEDIRSHEERFSKNYRLLLRFGAIDYTAKVWLDGVAVAEHRGGHVPFDVDLSNAIEPSSPSIHRLTVRVYDSAFDLTQPRGKQFWGPKSQDIWYTPSSGIWQSVWLESVPSIRLADSSYGTVLRSHDIIHGTLDAQIALVGRHTSRQACAVEVISSFFGVRVGIERRDLPRDSNLVQLDLNMRLSPDQVQELWKNHENLAPAHGATRWRDGVALWSPEHPLLYKLLIRLLNVSGEVVDEVKTTTGMRSLSWTNGDMTFRLNGEPYFQALLLDQGYWPETLMTAPSPLALKRDIELSKAMGFNGCRKHQKVEDPVFLYWADRIGFLVWGEMANGHAFSADYVDRFNEEWIDVVKRDINHPCIITWTPVNESWGYPDLGGSKQQRDHIRSLYYLTKTLDPFRPINDNCGWEHVKTDLTTFHEYADGNYLSERCASLKEILHRGRPMFVGPIYGTRNVEDPGAEHERGAPVMCTEFGGVNIAASSDDAKLSNWGYTTASNAQDLLKRVEELIFSVVKEGLCSAIVWTQFCDIEQEQNGLFTYNRDPKLPVDQVKGILQRAGQMYHSRQSH